MGEIKFTIKYDELLGRGGFGEVYTAYNIDDNGPIKTKYAAKKIPEDIQDGNNLFLFTNEILISTQFNNPNLVKFYGLTEDNDTIFMIYEYCNGGDLNFYLRKYYDKYKRSLTEKEVQKILKDTLNGLSCLHRNKVIHHDIKPQNILLHFNSEKDKEELNINNCTIKLSDFGLAKFKGEGELKHAYGTLPYMDPICSIYQKMSLFDEDKTDIWSIGIVTYKILFLNTHPFIPNNFYKNNNNPALNNNKILKKSIEKGNYYINIKDYTVSKEFLAFIDGCLKLNHKNRKSSEDLEYSWFLTRPYEKFSFINLDNFEVEIPDDYRYETNIKLDINNDNNIEDCFNL